MRHINELIIIGKTKKALASEKTIFILRLRSGGKEETEEELRIVAGIFH